MARQYSHRQFFRRTPNHLLSRFFQERHNVLQEFPFAEMTEVGVEPLFTAFTELPADTKVRIEAECQEIDAMACQGGVTALADEADFHGDTAFPAAIPQHDGFHSIVMWAFLEHKNYWAGATAFFHADNIADSFWKKRNDLPHLSPHMEDEDIKQLENAITLRFLTKEGRGRNCKVEVFRRHAKEYFFAYPEDYAQSDIEWEKNAFARRARHPAFEIIFVYCQNEGSLDIYAPRNTKVVPELQQIFATTMLKHGGLDEFAGAKRVYNLEGLGSRDFVFQYQAGSGIESVTVSRLRLDLKTGGSHRVTVEADTRRNPKAIYDLMDKLKLPPYYVSQARVVVGFDQGPSRRGRLRRFTISYPDCCALRHDGRDLVIRQMLAASGIEPLQQQSDDDGQHDD